MFGRLSGILCVVLLLTSGCSTSKRDNLEIGKILATRTSALNSRNMSQYLSVVSHNYSDKGKNFAQLKKSLEHHFRDIDQLSYEPDEYSITVNGSNAEAVGNYRMKIRLRGNEMSVIGTEHLKLAKEPEGWKIIAGI